MDEYEKAGVDKAADMFAQIEQLQAENKQLKKEKKDDIKEIERLCSLAKQLCEERDQALKPES